MLKDFEKVTPQIIQEFIEHKLFKCNLPKKYGGLDWDLMQTLDFFEVAAYNDGSLGWLLQIGNGGNYFASSFPEEVATEIFSDKSTVIAGSGAPTGIAVKVEKGYKITGKWPYCSGSDYANWFTMNCKVAGTDEIASFITRRNQVEVIEDWDTVGMRETSSNSIQATDIFIEDRFCFDVHVNHNHIENEVLNLPFVLYAELFFMAVVCGLVRKIASEAEDLIPCRSELDQKHIQEGVKDLLDNIEIIQNDVKRTLHNVSMKPNELEAHELGRRIKNFVNKVRIEIHQIYPHLGMRVIHASHPIATAYQDLITIAQHSMLRN